MLWLEAKMLVSDSQVGLEGRLGIYFGEQGICCQELLESRDLLIGNLHHISWT